jgi:hypothetical protein
MKEMDIFCNTLCKREIDFSFFNNVANFDDKDQINMFTNTNTQQFICM